MHRGAVLVVEHGEEGASVSEERKKSLGEVFVQFIRYATFGALCSATDTLIFWFFTSTTNWNPLYVNIFSTAIGVTLSFFFNRRYTFKVRDHAGKRYIAFFTIGALGLVCSEFIIGFGLHIFPRMAPVWVKLLAVALVGSFQFFLNRNISYRAAVGASDDDDDIV